jgi:hypothetical protein
MKKILLISLLIFLGISLTYAQSYEDVVYLHNGSVIRGLIIEQVPNESVKIQTYDGNIFVYKMSEIQKMAKELDDNSNYPQNRRRQTRRQVVRASLSPGYFGFTDLGFGIGANKAIHLGLDIVNGYRIIPQFAVGIGVGVYRYSKHTFYDDYDNVIEKVANSLSIPIFLHLRSDFLNGKISPFSAVNIGYNISLLDSRHKGLIFEPGVGVGIEVSPRNRLDISLGYSLMGTQVYDEYYGTNIKGNFGYFKIKVGMSW